VIRTAVLAIAIGALAAPALALEAHQAPAPRGDTSPFLNGSRLLGMMPAVASEAFRFGPSEQAQPRGPTVVYEVKGGKPSEQIDVTNARDNPFMPQSERRSGAAH